MVPSSDKHIIQIHNSRDILEQGYGGTIPTELKPNQIAIAGCSGYSGGSGYSGYRLAFRDKDGVFHDVANLNDTISGYSGYSGASGYSGTSGYSGNSGYSGISGYSGYSGISGYSGYSGASGYSGSTANFVGRKLIGNVESSNSISGVSGTSSYNISTIMSSETPVTSAGTDEDVPTDTPKK